MCILASIITRKLVFLSYCNASCNKSAVKSCANTFHFRYNSQFDLKRLAKTLNRFKMSVTNSSNMLKYAKLSDKAYAPTRGSKAAAGYDLRSAYEYVVPARGKELIKTDLQIEVPEGTYGRVAPRSGLAWKSHIDVGAGVIDADYRGNVGVVLFNLSDEDFKVSPGDRVAQLICERIIYPELQELDTLNDTERGEGGFGSTGKN